MATQYLSTVIHYKNIGTSVSVEASTRHHSEIPWEVSAIEITTTVRFKLGTVP